MPLEKLWSGGSLLGGQQGGEATYPSRVLFPNIDGSCQTFHSLGVFVRHAEKEKDESVMKIRAVAKTAANSGI